MKTVYLIRHGQSEGNVSPVFQSPDSPLSDEGKKQAKIMAERVRNLSFDALIASPLARAKETAELISASTNKEIEFSDIFIERIKPTSIHGKPYSDKQAMNTCREWEESLCGSGKEIEDGENFEAIAERADRALKYLEERKEQDIVVVTHGYFLRFIIERVILGEFHTGELHKSIKATTATQNTGITVLRHMEEDGKKVWKLWIYNDHAHLG